ncbi:MAG: hypothetical protein L0216_05160 [Planctomycetales bacterium]|nr:hypothetical protein [Planctomycetales bacterium]
MRDAARTLLAAAATIALCAAARAEGGEGDDRSPDFSGIAGLLGAGLPVDRGEGRSIPVVALLYLHDPPGSRQVRLDARFITSWLSVDARTPPAGGPVGGLGLEGEFRSVDQTIYRYQDGDFLGHRVFRTSNAGGSALAGWEFGKDARALVRYRLRRVAFDRTAQTHDGFVLPDDLTEQRLELEGSASDVSYFRSYELKQGWEVSVALAYVRRDRWRPYGDEPATLAADLREFQEFATGVARAGLALRLLGDQNLRASVSAGIGEDLDRLSAFPVGSFLGDWPIAGYYYAEFKADRVLLLNLAHALDLPILGLRAYLYLDTGLVRSLGERTRARTGLGLGTRIRGPMGAPILVRYGYAPRAHRGREDRGGHEISVQVAFAFRDPFAEHAG